MFKQKLVTILTVLFMLFTGMSVAIPVYAASGNTNGNFFSGLIQFIASTFHLDQTQVKTAVQTYQTQQKQIVLANMQTREKTRLDALVKTGKITSAQEQLIIAEIAVLQAKYNPANFKNLTAAQRKQQFQNEQSDIKTWAQVNGIDSKYIMPGFGMAGQGGFRGRGFGKWAKPSPTPTP
jgi:hypothetical protein